MNLENWLYRRDREEFILSFPNVEKERHQSRQEEANQEIDMELHYEP